MTSAVPTVPGEREPIPPRLLAEVESWIAADPDPSTRAELGALIEAEDVDGLRSRFERPLSFGTAGLRGPIGAGPARMNRLVVQRTTAGLARWVLGQGSETAGRGIVVGRDARHLSAEFAEDVAAVASGAGLAVRVLPGALPTPLTAFAVKHFSAAAGVMITASHNPAADNGYKVYMADGAQVIPPHDAAIADAARTAAEAAAGQGRPSSLSASAAQAGPIEIVDESELLGAYRLAVLRFLDPAGPRRLRIVYTPLHGVGAAVLPGLLEQAGFEQVSVVAAQAAPDPDFPTLAFPNPEEPGALDLALADASRLEADIVLANDPDADRLAVAVPDPASGSWRALTGDELGCLLADHVLATTEGDDRLVATTIVSSSMLARMAEDAGVACVETLTGFKWIARAASRRPGRRLVFGYEEALGYEVGDVVSDKDGLSAALVAAEMAAKAKERGTSVVSLLEALACRFGVHMTSQWSLRLAGPSAPSQMADIVGRWRTDTPRSLAGLAVTDVVDLSQPTGELPVTDALVIHLEAGARVVLRPSGTEPKLKAYFEVASRPVPRERLADEQRGARRILDELELDVAARCAPSVRSEPSGA